MKRHYLIFTVIFFVMLLLPVSSEFFISFKEGRAFAPADIGRDFLRPILRESELKLKADSLARGLEQVLAAAEAGGSLSEEIAALDAVAENLRGSLLSLNAYSTVDSSSPEIMRIAEFRRLLADFENDGDLRDSLEHVARKISAEYGSFHVGRVASAWWNHGFLDGKYLHAYEKNLEKENAFVKKTRPAYQAFAWHVLRDPGEKAVPADSGFLFYRQDVEFLVRPDPWTSDSLDNPIEAVVDFQKELQKFGAELLVVVVPGKPSVYPEFLNPVLYGRKGRGFSPAERFLDSLSARGIQTVNLFPVLQKAKLKDRDGDFLYLFTDTHWTPRGARVAAKAIADRVKKYPFYGEISHELLQDSLVSVERTGDVATMSDLESEFPAQVVEAHVVKNAKTGQPLRSDFRKSKILILGDSFSRIYETDAPMSAGWISQFAEELQIPVASVVSDGGASTLVREKLARRSGVLKNKKLVIWEFVERDLRFGAEGWKKVRFD